MSEVAERQVIRRSSAINLPGFYRYCHCRYSLGGGYLKKSDEVDPRRQNFIV